MGKIKPILDKKDPKWFVILIKILSVLVIGPIIIGCIWSIFMYATHKINYSHESYFLNPNYAIPLFVIGIGLCSMILYQRLKGK